MKRLLGLLLGAAALLGSACTMEGASESEESVGEVQAAVTYDTAMVKPVPKSFLTKKMSGNVCCTGAGKKASDCSDACADTKGLITPAGYNKGADYYRATAQASLDTLDKWKAYYNFPRRIPGESISDFRKRANIVIYYNRTELALGRELGCWQEGNTSIACFVTNYGDSFGSVHDLLTPDAGSGSGLEYARQGYAQPKNTVVISYDTRRESVQGDGTAVQFAAFGPDGKRLQKAQLDEQGARPIPQICMSCHGGVWDANARAANGSSNYYGISRFARFLPLITSTVTFSAQAPYALADQQDAIKSVNQAAWRARGTGLTFRQRALMSKIYKTTNAGDGVVLSLRRAAMMADTISYQALTPTRQYHENAWPPGWSTLKTTYTGVVLPYCDTCHMAMDSSSGWKDLAGQAITADPARMAQAGIAYTILDSLANATTPANKTILQVHMGTVVNANGLGIFDSDRTKLTMPHAEQAFARFWGDKSGAGGFKCSLFGKTLPPGDCLMYDLGIWPNGRAQPLTAQNPTGIDWAKLAPASDSECGQSVTAVSDLTGVNAGRRLTSVALPAPLDTTFVNQCGDGCRAGALCPGSEGATAYSFPGVRQECRPLSAGSSYGSCVSCGRISEPACIQVGASCDTTLNPNCNNLNLQACHEGTVSYGFCSTADLSHASVASASQSSNAWGGVAARAIDGNYSGVFSDNSVTHTDSATDPAPWWKIDFAWIRKVKKITLYNRTDCCSNRLGNFVIESSTNDVDYVLVPGGDFTGVFPSSSSSVIIHVPKAVDARYIRIRHLVGGPPGENVSVLSLAEVSIYGWN